MQCYGCHCCVMLVLLNVDSMCSIINESKLSMNLSLDF